VVCRTPRQSHGAALSFEAVVVQAGRMAVAVLLVVVVVYRWAQGQ